MEFDNTMFHKWKYVLFVCVVFNLLVFCLSACKSDTEEEKSETTTQTTEQENTEQDSSEEMTTEEISDDESSGIDQVTLDGMSRDILAGMTLEEKVGQLFFVGKEALTEEMTWQPGGIILYSKNMKNQKQTKKMIEEFQSNAKIPLFIGTQEAGGEDSRIASVKGMKIKPQPSSAKLAAANDTSKTEEAADTIAAYMKELGFNVNFAPSANLVEEENSTLFGENTYGSDKKLVSELTSLFIEGMQKNDVCAVLSPFPGQGATKEDTRKGPVDISRTINELRKTEFVPFSAGIKTGVDFIQVGHASYSAVMENQTPASLSKLMVTEILRKELGFDSIIITDSMNEKAITDHYTTEEASVQAIKAGVDMLLYPGEEVDDAYQAILEAVEEGKIEESAIEESVFQILRVKIQRGIIPENTDLIDTKN